MSDEEQIIRDTIRGFRSREIENLWEKLNRPEREHYTSLWAGLAEVGVPLMGLPELAGGLNLGPQARFDLLFEIGRGCPALGVGVIQHVTALNRLPELPAQLADAAGEARFAYVGNPLDAVPTSDFSLRRNGSVVLKGKARVALGYAEYLVVPASEDGQAKLAIIKADAQGVHFAGQTSSNGLRLLEFGELSLDTSVDPAMLFDATDGVASAQEADGLLCALLVGTMAEQADRASAYALERYQGGKMIHEHDAVQQLIAPMLLSERAGRAIALAALADTGPGDAGASAMLIPHARQVSLDSVQTYGGYGYMEDYRAERYLRDTNTLETFFVHAGARGRAIARARFAELQA